ncbi:hypothetical protein GCK32_003342 [Trichostrongylus colubriformis]|uniref:Uncharacterized protein n=1 Tax=Trichostrongylus colubriformis TaxID=6319 RepID=A0AAN8IMV4_TRICO
MFSSVRQFCNGGDDSRETTLEAFLLNTIQIRSQIYDKMTNSYNVAPSKLLFLLIHEDSTLQDGTPFETISAAEQPAPELRRKATRHPYNPRPPSRSPATKEKVKRC